MDTRQLHADLRRPHVRVRVRGEQFDFAVSGGAPTRSGTVDKLEQIPAPRDLPILLIVPGERVRIHEVAVPGRNRRRFLQGLAYALEDRLLNDPDLEHVVPLTRLAREGSLAVAVVASSLMHEWLEMARAGDRELLGITPDFSCLEAPPPGAWRLRHRGSRLLVRCDSGRCGMSLGLPGDRHPPAALLLGLDDTAAPPQRIIIERDEDVGADQYDTWTRAFEPRGMTVVYESASPSWSSAAPAINLMSGSFRARRTTTPWRRAVPALGLAAALVVALGIELWLEVRSLQHERVRLEADIEAVYRDAFPDSRNVIDPRFQMEQALTGLAPGADRSDADSNTQSLLNVLERVATILADLEDHEVITLDLRDGTMRIDISVADYATLELLRDALGKVARADIENSRKVETRIVGRIALKVVG